MLMYLSVNVNIKQHMRKYFFFILCFLIVGCLFSCDKAKNYMLGSFEPYREMFGLSHIDVEDSIINVTIPAPSSFVRVGELVYEVEPTVIDEEVFNYLHSGDYMGNYYINLFTTYTDEYGQEQKTNVGIIGQVSWSEVQKYKNSSYYHEVSNMIYNALSIDK